MGTFDLLLTIFQLIRYSDTVRTRLQTNQFSGVYRNTFDAIRQLVVQESWRSFYKGFGIGISSIPITFHSFHQNHPRNTLYLDKSWNFFHQLPHYQFPPWQFILLVTITLKSTWTINFHRPNLGKYTYYRDCLLRLRADWCGHQWYVELDNENVYDVMMTRSL